MFNCHTHTIHSHDGKNTVVEMVESGILKGLKGITFTDHVDLLLFEERDIYNQILLLKEDVFKAKQIYKDKFKVLFGMELGEELYEPKLAQKMRDIGGFDCILASLHFYKPLKSEYDLAYADIPLWSNEKIKDVMLGYFSIIKEMATSTDFDVLAHITYPLRYINAIYKKNFDYKVFENLIVEILSALVKREKSLELNTSNAVKQNFYMPDEYILKTYNDLGGRLITIGSDSHNISNVDNGLILGKELLKKCGFKEYYYYEERKPFIAEKL